MADQAPKVHIVQRNLHPHTNAVQALTITVHYGNDVEAEATILLRPGAVPNDEKNIRQEIERLGSALIAAAKSPNGITS
jgi:hypothetical protein